MGRVGESRIGFEQLICRLPGSREQLYIVSQVGDGKLGQTMLALPEEVAGAPEFEVLFCHFKAAVGAAHGAQPDLGVLAFAV